MKSFEEWFCELISDEIWYEQAGKKHKTETFKNVAEQVYTLSISDRDAMSIIPLREHRNHVTNKLAKILPDKPKVKWWEIEQKKKEAEEEEKKQLEWKPASDEHVAKCVAEFDEMLKNSPMLNSRPRISYKQQVEEGGWIPKRDKPWPMTTPMEAYNKERKICYYRHCFDLVTREKLPTFVEEEIYNAEFDKLMIKKKIHPNWEILQSIEKEDAI